MRADVFTARHVKAIRAWLGWSALVLAKRANIGVSTLRDFECGLRKTSVASRRAVRMTLEAEGIVLTEHGFFQVEK